MQKINFQNLPSTTTPVNATNLNALQDNVEDVFDGDVPMGNVVVDSIRSKNMLNFSSFSTQTIYGITFTNNGDGSITINGTANQDFGVSFIQFKIKAGQYYLSTNASATTTNAFYLYDHDENVGYGYGSITLNSDHNNMGFETWITNGTSFSNVTIQPQLEKGSTATNYAPYQFGENGDVFINGKLYTSNAGREDYADFGFYYDGAGNMQHKRNNAGDQFQIKAHDGTAKVIILPETGNVDTFGNITFIPLQTQTLDLNLVGTTYVASQEVALHNTGNIQNAPANNEVAILKSYSWGGNPDWCMQEWFGLNNGGSLSKYIRQHTPAGWNAWQRII